MEPPPISSPPPGVVPPLPPPVVGGYDYRLAAEFQARQDADHLRLLSIFHYVVGGLTALFASIFVIYIVMGLFFVLNPGLTQNTQHPEQAPPAFFGWIFVAIGSFIVLLGWTMAALTVYAGFCLKRREKRTFSLVVAGFNCLQVPFGTILGVFTLIVLQRPSVQALYRR